MMHSYRISQLEIIALDLGSLFISDKEITPERIDRYELLDFAEFFRWTTTNIEDKGSLQAKKEANQKLERLQLETARNMFSWGNNPDSIHIPIRIFDTCKQK